MEILECEFRQAFMTAFARKQGRMSKGWKVELFAKIVLLICESLIIVVSCKLYGRRMRGESLDDYLTLHFSSPGTASNLGEELECSFSSPEVRCVEREISVQYSCEGNIWKACDK